MPKLTNADYALIHTGSDPGVSTVISPVSQDPTRIDRIYQWRQRHSDLDQDLAEAFDVGKEMLERG